MPVVIHGIRVRQEDVYKGVSMKELNKKQTKEYFEKVTRKCINSWELYNAHMYVAISDSR